MSEVKPGSGEGGPRVGPGRPAVLAEDERRRQLLDAAERLFLSKGYAASTMEDVARGAGMSKKTLYRVFDSKAVLFEALLGDRYLPLTLPIGEESGGVEEVLTRVLTRMIVYVLSPRMIAMLRLMISEATFSGDIAPALDRLGIGRGKGGLEQWVASQARLGTIRTEDPRAAARTLFFTAGGDLLLNSLLGLEAGVEAAVIDARVREAVGAFMLRMRDEKVFHPECSGC